MVDVSPSLSLLLEAVALGLAASWVALLVHECGHAAAARLVGVRIWGVRLGMGPVLWAGMVGDVRVRLALFPVLGAVHLLDEDASAIGYRDIARGRWRFEWGPGAWRAPIISASGGLANLLMLSFLLLGWKAFGQPLPGTLAGDTLFVMIGANLAGYLNLLPCFRSDGNHLLAHVRAARVGPAGPA